MSADERCVAGGRPVNPAAQARARDPESGLVLPHGEAGELEFHAPSRMQCYFGDPEATREAFTGDGFYRSGDLGHTTGDGRFVFLARINDSLRLGGFLVSPLEIEAVVQQGGKQSAVDLREDAGFMLEPHPRRGREQCRRSRLDDDGLAVNGIGCQQGFRVRTAL